MEEEKDIYDKYFFDFGAEMPSAGAVVDILMKHFNPVSVVDVGCGPGIYLERFALRGIDVLGCDLSRKAVKNSPVGEKIRLHDLRFPFIVYRKFSLCLCVEVGEHLPSSAAEILVGSLANLSDTVAFSAATPGQGSLDVGHINEQPHEFWIEKFKDRGFKFDEKETGTIRREMKEKDVIWWVVNNMMIFKKQAE